MQTVTTIEGLRAALAPLRARGKTVGLVPTMGYLHVGHMELVRRARAENDVVVASIFVNPLQFGAGEDLTRYPRDLPRDQKMLEEEGVDFMFAPGVSDMYPRPMATVVDVPWRPVRSPCEELAGVLAEARARGVPEEDLAFVRHLLGTGSPGQVARELDVTARTVRNRRAAVSYRVRRAVDAA